jgi:transcriptional regulator with XRE-family HTH domain
MATRPKTEALVQPEMLRWARDTAGLSLEEASRAAQTNKKKIEAWETGDARPSMPQLRKMAAAYKRLLSDFYLPAPPAENPLPHDFRRLPGHGLFGYSRVWGCPVNITTIIPGRIF